MAEYRGQLVLVVGPSGAGKDSVLRGARTVLAGNRRIVFPRRFVTRFTDAGAEDHLSMSDMEFGIAVAKDAFALWWQAHGNSYGIGKSIEADLEAGRVVALNCSRAILAEAADRFPHVTVVEVSAPAEVLVRRIVARGRETEEQAMARVARLVPSFPSGVPVVRIDNDGPLDRAIDRFCDLLERLERGDMRLTGATIEDDREVEGDAPETEALIQRL